MLNNNLPPNLSALKAGWSWLKLGDVCEVNPKLPINKLKDDLDVSFLPMKAVEELSGRIDISDERKLGKVKKGYTYFENEDVIFAKITPCMENGKVAILNKLKNGIGFGSTEFHVLRCSDAVLNKYLFNYLIQSSYRKIAKRNMTGTAGQLRFPKRFIENTEIPLPPLAEQKKIVAKIEELFSELDNGIEQLKKAKQQLKIYRQVVLNWAFSGKLVRGKTADSKGKTEIFKAAEPKVEYNASHPELVSGSNGLPVGWKWVKLGDVAKIKGGKRLPKGESYSEIKTDFPYIRVIDFENMSVKMDDLRYLKKETQNHIKNYFISKKDLYISIAGTIGRVGTIPEKLDGANLTENAAKITEIQNYNLIFLSYLMNSSLVQNQIKTLTISTTQPKLALFRIEKLDLPQPPIQQQLQIVEEIESRFSVADKLEQTIDENLSKSETLRQSILKKAFEGGWCN